MYWHHRWWGTGGPGNEPIIPGIKFSLWWHMTMWQAVSVLPAGLAWLWSVWKSSGRNLLFWKDAAPVPGTTPRSSPSIGAVRAGQSRLAPAPDLAPPMLLVSPQPASQIFSISHRSYFSHRILFYLWILNLMFKNNWIHFYSCWKEHRRLVHFEYYFKYLSITRNGNPIFGSNNQS